MNITDSQPEYVKFTRRRNYKNAGIRVKADLRNEKIGFKNPRALRRVPFICWSVVM